MTKLNGGAGPAPAPTLTPPQPQTPEEIWARVPSAAEIFDRPYSPPGPIPPAWDAEKSIGAEDADRKCARLIVNAHYYDPPITEREIADYARRFGATEREVELALRRQRS